MTVRLQSLRLRVLVLVALVLVPALLLILLSSQQLRKARIADVERDAQRIARTAAEEEDRLIEGARQLLTTLSRLPEVIDAEPDCSALLGSLLHELPQYSNIGAARPDGRTYCSALPVPEDATLAGRRFFERAVERKAFSVGEYEIGAVSGRATLGLARPILDGDGAVVAVVFAGLDVQWLDRITRQLELPEKGIALVLGPNGVVLAGKQQPSDLVGAPLPSPSLLDHVRSGARGAIRTDELEETDRIYASAALRVGYENIDLWVVVGLPAAEAYAEVDAVTRRSLALLLALGLASLVAAWLGGHYFVLRPVRVLARTADRLRRGDLSARTGLVAGVGAGELGELARSFDAMAASLERSLWLREAFIAAAAHELRTPSTSLKSYTQLLLRRDGERSERDRRALQRIDVLADRVARLALELEETDALARGVRLALSRVEVKALVEEVAAEVRERRPDQRLVVEGEEVFARLDPARFRLCLRGLLENALRHRSTSEARAGIERVGDEVVLEVADDGPGIEPERLPDVFEPLFEPWPPGSPWYTGVIGLGLYLARAIVEAHGGSVEVWSELGEGSRFRVRLPVGEGGAGFAPGSRKDQRSEAGRP